MRRDNAQIKLLISRDDTTKSEYEKKKERHVFSAKKRDEERESDVG